MILHVVALVGVAILLSIAGRLGYLADRRTTRLDKARQN